MSDSEKEYTIRTQGDRAYTYGLGEKVSDGVYLFKDGHYDLSKQELDAAISRIGKGVIR